MHPFNPNNSFIQTTPRTKIKLYRSDQSKTESENLTGGRNGDELATVIFS